LNGRDNPNRRGDDGHRFLRLRERDTSGDTTTLSQRGSRRLLGLSGRQHLPQGERRGRKRRRARKHWRDLGEGKNAGLDRTARGDRGRPHRARSSEGPVLREGGRRRPLEGDAVVHAVIVVPPFADSRCSVPSNEDHVMIGKPLLVKLKGDHKAETIPRQVLGTTIAISKSTNRIAYSPRSGEGRREVGERSYVLAGDLRGRLPVVESKPDRNLLLESNVTNEDRPIESRWSRLRKRQGLDVDVGVGIGGVGQGS